MRPHPFLLPMVGSLACSGGSAGPEPDDAGIKGGTEDGGLDDDGVEDTDAQFAAFYAEHGGREAFPEHTVAMIEAMLYAQDEVDQGDLAAARARIDAIFATYPLSEAI